MIILGIDPGTARVGWAVLDKQKTTFHALAYGCIETEKTESPQERLLIIYKKILEIVVKYKPDFVSIELLFFASNAKTVMAVGQARGVIILAAATHNIPVVSYSPPAVKLTICGNGRAEKKDVQKTVTKLLHLRKPPKPDDTADALAIALTHGYRLNGHTAKRQEIAKK